MVGGTPSPLSERERSLYRLLQHAVLFFDPECRRCLQLEARFDDGPQHFLDNESERASRIEEALRGILARARVVETYLELAPVPDSARTVGFDLTSCTEAALRLLVEPLYARRPDPFLQRRTPVTLIYR